MERAMIVYEENLIFAERKRDLLQACCERMVGVVGRSDFLRYEAIGVKIVAAPADSMAVENGCRTGLDPATKDSGHSKAP